MNERGVAVAYLSGVLHGDAWLTRELGLRVKDLDFAEAFCSALLSAFNVRQLPRLDERGYWLVRLRNASRRFDSLRDVVPDSNEERAEWLRGLFDSEGNAQLNPLKRQGPGSFGRRVAMYSTNLDTLRTAGAHLSAIGIAHVTRATKNSAGHKGTKVVYELAIRPGRDNYARFAELVGSSIARKRQTLAAIVSTYASDLSAVRRAAQREGAKTKLRKTHEQTIPAVIATIASRLSRGEPVTNAACAGVVCGYRTALHYMTHRQLVEAARRKCA